MIYTSAPALPGTADTLAATPASGKPTTPYSSRSATLRWQFSPRTALAIAYRYLDMDYEDGEGSNYFKYDVATSGPAMGVVFTF
jgi:hypothetical protein